MVVHREEQIMDDVFVLIAIPIIDQQEISENDNI